MCFESDSWVQEQDFACRIAAIQFLGRDIVDEQGDIPPEHKRSFMPTTPPAVLDLPPDVLAITNIRPQIMRRYESHLQERETVERRRADGGARRGGVLLTGKAVGAPHRGAGAVPPAGSRLTEVDLVRRSALAPRRTQSVPPDLSGHRAAGTPARTDRGWAEDRLEYLRNDRALTPPQSNPTIIEYSRELDSTEYYLEIVDALSMPGIEAWAST